MVGRYDYRAGLRHRRRPHPFQTPPELRNKLIEMLGKVERRPVITSTQSHGQCDARRDQHNDGYPQQNPPDPAINPSPLGHTQHSGGDEQRAHAEEILDPVYTSAEAIGDRTLEQSVEPRHHSHREETGEHDAHAADHRERTRLRRDEHRCCEHGDAEGDTEEAPRDCDLRS